MTQSSQLMALRRGISTPEVGNWQRFLNQKGIVDSLGNLLVEDEQFGARTEYATSSYQANKALETTGLVDEATRKVAKLEGFIPFIQAQGVNYVTSRKIRLLVIHTMETAEKPGTANGVALWFAGRIGKAPKASAHYTIDSEEVVQCVRERDVAWAAPGANNDGIHLEHAGRASQSPDDWRDRFSQLTLARSVMLAAQICLRHQLPIVKLVKNEILKGEKGICGHMDITASYPGPGRTHWDPGPGFVWGEYLEALMRETARLQKAQRQ